MNVISVRVEQEITDLFPGTLASGPRTEQLNRISARLRPPAARLQSFIKLPTKVLAPFMQKDRPPYLSVGDARTALPRVVPKPFPLIKATPVYGVDVCCASHLVMTKDSRLKKDSNSFPSLPPGPQSKCFKYPFELTRKVCRDQGIAGWRVDSITSARSNWHHPSHKNPQRHRERPREFNAFAA